MTNDDAFQVSTPHHVILYTPWSGHCNLDKRIWYGKPKFINNLQNHPFLWVGFHPSQVMIGLWQPGLPTLIMNLINFWRFWPQHLVTSTILHPGRWSFSPQLQAICEPDSQRAAHRFFAVCKDELKHWDAGLWGGFGWLWRGYSD